MEKKSQAANTCSDSQSLSLPCEWWFWLFLYVQIIAQSIPKEEIGESSCECKFKGFSWQKELFLVKILLNLMSPPATYKGNAYK